MSMLTAVHSAVAQRGASAAWVSQEPAVVRARQLVLAGQLRDAEDALRNEDTRAADEMREIIRRIRLAYRLDERGMLEKLGRSIPGATALDLANWREKGELQYRVLDGKLFHFVREPANLFRFSEQAKARRNVVPPAPAFNLEEHLKQVILAARSSGKRHVLPMRHRVKYEITIPGIYPAGQMVRAWLPFPQEQVRQTNVRLLNSWPNRGMVADNGLPHRSIFFEQKVGEPGKEMRFGLEFEYVCWADYTQLKDEDARQPSADMSQYLAERLPHIHFSPQVREIVMGVVGQEKNPLRKARRIFEWVSNQIRYNSEEEYSIIPSLCDRGIERQKGDCGVQALVFITLCRAAGVPARWQSGWETRPPNGDMHDWAEIYVEPWGWLPVDPSYGLRKSDDPDVRWFYFGHLDSYRLIVNLDYGRELWPAKASMRSEPADFQRGEVEVGGKNLYFDQWDWEMSFAAEPADR